MGSLENVVDPFDALNWDSSFHLCENSSLVSLDEFPDNPHFSAVIDGRSMRAPVLLVVQPEPDNGYEEEEAVKKPQNADSRKRKRRITPLKNSIKEDDEEKGNPNGVELSKVTCIHMRAKRGQATSSHSLAERVRREKISERMKLLQELVPGCNKITGKAVMLDEIINYVQSLQKQVEFLSMKIATVNTEMNMDLDQILSNNILNYGSSSNVEQNSWNNDIQFWD